MITTIDIRFYVQHYITGSTVRGIVVAHIPEMAVALGPLFNSSPRVHHTYYITKCMISKRKAKHTLRAKPSPLDFGYLLSSSSQQAQEYHSYASLNIHREDF